MACFGKFLDLWRFILYRSKCKERVKKVWVKLKIIFSETYTNEFVNTWHKKRLKYDEPLITYWIPECNEQQQQQQQQQQKQYEW